MKRNLRADIILIAGLVLAGAVLGAVLLLRGGAGASVEVSVSGEIVGTYPLAEDRTVTIEGKDGTNELVIESGAARLSDADCPDQLCVHMGEIKKDGQSIICLPHEVVITVRSDAPEDENEVDAVAGGRQ